MPVRITIELRPWESPTVEPSRVMAAIEASGDKGASTRELMKTLQNVSISAISRAAWQLILDKKVRTAWTHVARGTQWAPPVEARYWVLSTTIPTEEQP